MALVGEVDRVLWRQATVDAVHDCVGEFFPLRAEALDQSVVALAQLPHQARRIDHLLRLVRGEPIPDALCDLGRHHAGPADIADQRRGVGIGRRHHGVVVGVDGRPVLRLLGIKLAALVQHALDAVAPLYLLGAILLGRVGLLVKLVALCIPNDAAPVERGDVVARLGAVGETDLNRTDHGDARLLLGQRRPTAPQITHGRRETVESLLVLERLERRLRIALDQRLRARVVRLQSVEPSTRLGPARG